MIVKLRIVDGPEIKLTMNYTLEKLAQKIVDQEVILIDNELVNLKYVIYAKEIG